MSVRINRGFSDADPLVAQDDMESWIGEVNAAEAQNEEASLSALTADLQRVSEEATAKEDDALATLAMMRDAARNHAEEEMAAAPEVSLEERKAELLEEAVERVTTDRRISDEVQLPEPAWTLSRCVWAGGLT